MCLLLKKNTFAPRRGRRAPLTLVVPTFVSHGCLVFLFYFDILTAGLLFLTFLCSRSEGGYRRL
jgi:hypothetical protein